MNESKLDNLFEQIFKDARRQPGKISFVTAGGGAELFRIFQVPGISEVMVEARMLYHPSSFEEFLGDGLFEQYVSQSMADKLALRLSKVSSADICLAVTSALQTNRTRMGANRGFLSIVENGQLVCQQHLVIEGDSRRQQDIGVSISVLTELKKILNPSS